MKENHKKNTISVFHYLIYKRIKESDTSLSFFDFIQKLEKLQKKYTIRSSVCNVKNRRVTSYSILFQKKAV
ncbi:hypothetical protein [Helicobacter pylori]|uniref:hypothetical protein n=1 Tax=Helicobacter pylori TaxID=210 RepID=UPI000EAF400E|nr:hypothetical protein [Helicobacter pylori]RKV02561.1 hypothetical protein DDP44_08110 [Helicobacter pylori]WQX57615.1 hypothetical protein KVL95_06655 [Helicobacter pylori]